MIHALRRAALALGIALAGAGAQAECGGPSLLDRLDPTERAAMAARLAATPRAEGLLWLARRGGARVLVAGTLHLPDPRHRATLLALAPAIARADRVLLETTPEEESRMAGALAASPALALGGTALDDRLDPAVWTAVAAAARARGLAPEAAARLRPWLLTLAIATPPCAAAPPGAEGLDRMVLRAARAEGVPVSPLEPWDALFRAFDADPQADLAMLTAAILDPGPAEALLVAMREAYFAGRAAETWELSRAALRHRPAAMGPADPLAFDRLSQALLARRNAAWVPVIEAAAAQGPHVVVAAGAAHLPGEAGLLALLEARGWSIEPLDPAACCRDAFAPPGS